MKTTYTPINCSYYDRLEAWATLREELDVYYYDQQGQEQYTRGRIVDLQTKDGVEYTFLSGGQVIRLDHLKKINDEPVVLAC